ncbi:MAG TPA: DUF2249 domain-containing protein [Bacteroidota bacterium]
MSELQTLDVRPIPIQRKHPAIFETFDRLTAGEFFQLVNDHEPRPLFYQFQFERPGQFTWEYVEQGPTVWRVNITKL